MENEEELVVDINTTEDTDDTSEDTTTDENDVDVESLRAELERERQAKLQITARAKRAEAEVKALKQKSPNPVPTENVDERILRSQGLPDDLLKELRVIAQIRNTGLIEAQADPVFKALKDNYDKEIKIKEASLPSSKGSGRAEVKKDFKTANLPREEHMKMFKSKVGM
jgi:hypothetical protein